MKKSWVKDGNYITIQSFMVKDLKLKGNELLTYAIIYGFSQNGESKVTGSLQYRADWTKSTTQGVMKNLKALVEKGLIVKTDIYENGVKFVKYHVTEFNPMQQNSTGYETELNGGMQQSLTPPMQQSLPNNISTDSKLNIIREIIDYLNEKAETKYKANTAKTVECISARLKEGFTIEDFKTVIDKKTAEWKGTDFEQYLRPTTLFGTKFEGYLNAKINTQTKKPAPTIMDDYRAMEEKIKTKGLFG